jgi:riboflavin transporter FmnP
MDFDAVFFILRFMCILPTYMHNIVEKHFSISIAPVQSRSGSLVIYIPFNMGKFGIDRVCTNILYNPFYPPYYKT